MKIIVTSVFDVNTEPVSDIISNRLAKYCELNNYTYMCKKFNEKLDPWYKIEYLINLLKTKTCDYLCWFDIDMYIIDLKYRLEDLITDINKNIYVSTDNSGICSGFILIRNTEHSIKLLETLLFLTYQNFNSSLPYTDKIGGFPINDEKVEQNPLKVLCFYFQKVENMIGYIKQSIIMNPSSSDKDLPFIFHFWSFKWSKKENMMKHLSNLENNVVNVDKLKKWYE